MLLPPPQIRPPAGVSAGRVSGRARRARPACAFIPSGSDGSLPLSRASTRADRADTAERATSGFAIKRPHRRRVQVDPIGAKQTRRDRRGRPGRRASFAAEADVAQVLADDPIGAGQQAHAGLALVAERARLPPLTPAARCATSFSYPLSQAVRRINSRCQDTCSAYKPSTYGSSTRKRTGENPNRPCLRQSCLLGSNYVSNGKVRGSNYLSFGQLSRAATAAAAAAADAVAYRSS